MAGFPSCTDSLQSRGRRGCGWSSTAGTWLGARRPRSLPGLPTEGPVVLLGQGLVLWWQVVGAGQERGLAAFRGTAQAVLEQLQVLDDRGQELRSSTGIAPILLALDALEALQDRVDLRRAQAGRPELARQLLPFADPLAQLATELAHVFGREARPAARVAAGAVGAGTVRARSRIVACATAAAGLPRLLSGALFAASVLPLSGLGLPLLSPSLLLSFSLLAFAPLTLLAFAPLAGLRRGARRLALPLALAAIPQPLFQRLEV